MRIAVVGLGKLGAPLAAVMASKGNDVLGIDVNPEAVRLLNEGRRAGRGAGASGARLELRKERLEATTDLAAAADARRDDPARPDPVGRARRVHERVRPRCASRRSGGVSPARDDYHVVVVASTVMPGSCEAEIGPALERASGRRVGETLGLCYSPEFIALGNVIRDMLEPDMVLIGESDSRAGDVLERLYAGVCENDPPFRRMSLVNAELTKIAVNTYVTMKISYANTLADMCERLPGADVEAVTDALGLDTPDRREVPPRRDRLRRALLPARQQGVRRARPRPRRRAAARGGDRRGQRRPDRTPCADRPVAPRRTASAVGILGLAYKPDTGVIEESPGVALARASRHEAGHGVDVYDPVATEAALACPRWSRAAAQPPIARAARAVRRGRDRDALAGVRRPPSSMRSRREGEPLVVIDCWRLLSDEGHTTAQSRSFGSVGRSQRSSSCLDRHEKR